MLRVATEEGVIPCRSLPTGKFVNGLKMEGALIVLAGFTGISSQALFRNTSEHLDSHQRGFLSCIECASHVRGQCRTNEPTGNKGSPGTSSRVSSLSRFSERQKPIKECLYICRILGFIPLVCTAPFNKPNS